jgi:hypothetical protein
MSRKERDRLTIMTRVKQRVMTLVVAAGLWAQFFAEETTRASYDVLEGWVRRHGLPRSLYVDRDSISGL